MANLDQIQFIAIDSTRIILLDVLRNTLFEYDSSLNDWTTIAEQGRGPGDLMFSSDITMVGNLLYVTVKDGKLTIFDCTNNPPCTYDKTIILDKMQPTAVAKNGEKMIIMGQLSSLSNYSTIIEETDLKSLALIDTTVKVEKFFGKCMTYRVSRCF